MPIGERKVNKKYRNKKRCPEPESSLAMLSDLHRFLKKTYVRLVGERTMKNKRKVKFRRTVSNKKMPRAGIELSYAKRLA